MKNQTCLFTGSTSGIGYQTCLQLSKKYNLILPVRNLKKGYTLQDEIKQISPDCIVSLIECDLSDWDQVAKMCDFVVSWNFEKAEEINQVAGKEINCLFLNAGLWNLEMKTNKQGFEETIAVNHLSHFLILQKLLPKLYSGHERSKILITSSMGHRKTNASLNFDNLDSCLEFDRFQSYFRSKLFNLMTALKLYRNFDDNPLEEPKITVNAVHPGVIATNLLKVTPPKLLVETCEIFGLGPKFSASNLYKLATDKTFENISGKYFVPYNIFDASKLPVVQNPSKISQNLDFQDMFWGWSMEKISKYL
jgi:NAD(P)-dependent dehydrogenase (short-subunit alcohol dehydrogenase family)